MPKNGRRVLTDVDGKQYYADGYHPDSENQNLDVADKSEDQPVNEEGIKLEFDDPTETQNPEVLDGESLVDEIQKVAGKGAEEKQEEKKFNSEGLLKEIQEVHRGSQIDLDESEKNETEVDPKKDKQNDKEGTRAPETTPEQQPSLMRRFLKSIPFIGGMIADALLGEENKGATIVSVEVTHGSPDGFRKDFINAVTGFNAKLQETAKNQAASLYDQITGEGPVSKDTDVQTSEKSANSEIKDSSPSTPEADKKTEETKDKKEEKSLGEILKEAIEKAAQDDKAAGNNNKMDAIKGIIDKYEKGNESEDKNKPKDPELKKLTDQCREQISQIEGIEKEEAKGLENDKEKGDPRDVAAKEEFKKQEPQNEGGQHQDGLVTSIADTGTADLMNSTAKSMVEGFMSAAQANIQGRENEVPNKGGGFDDDIKSQLKEVASELKNSGATINEKSNNNSQISAAAGLADEISREQEGEGR